MASAGNAAGDASTGSTGSNCCKFMEKLGLRPVTRCSLAKFYAPAFGAVSYTGLSVTIVNPGLIVEIFPERHFSYLMHFLLAGTLTGSGSYIYTREHMKSATPRMKVLYSMTGALLLSFGSVLMWAVLRSIVPRSRVVGTVAAVGTAVAVVKAGTSYFDFVDGQIAKK